MNTLFIFVYLDIEHAYHADGHGLDALMRNIKRLILAVALPRQLLKTTYTYITLKRQK